MASLNWDSSIENDGSDFKLLEPGVYPFVVKGVEKTYYNGGSKIPPCPKALLTLRINGETDVTDGLLLDDSLEWKLCQFFTAIGARRHGERMKMDWDNLVGKAGYVEIGRRKWTGNDGQERDANQVERYIDPTDVFTTAPQPAAQSGSAW